MNAAEVVARVSRGDVTDEALTALAALLADALRYVQSGGAL